MNRNTSICCSGAFPRLRYNSLTLYCLCGIICAVSPVQFVQSLWYHLYCVASTVCAVSRSVVLCVMLLMVSYGDRSFCVAAQREWNKLSVKMKHDPFVDTVEIKAENSFI